MSTPRRDVAPPARTWQPEHWTATDASCPGEPPFWVYACPACSESAVTCAACIAAFGDPQPDDFNVIPFEQACAEADRYLAGELELDDRVPNVQGVHRCCCGRWYGTYSAGGTVFVAAAPGCVQVDRCLRCGIELVPYRAEPVDVDQLTFEVPA